MRISVLDTAQDAAHEVAGMLIAQVEHKPRSVLGLATGRTMEPVYQAVIERAAHLFGQVRSFNLDEYVGLAPSNVASFHHYMNTHFLRHLSPEMANAAIPDGCAEDLEAEALAFERSIANAGGIDFQLLGIGVNGHIGFNEPNTPFSSRTRVEALADATRRANASQFASLSEVPTHAITVGIGTILEARKCVLLATGDEKAAAVARMVAQPCSTDCPASCLQLHSDAHIILDGAAAGALRRLGWNTASTATSGA